jgi:hypothetical protein
MNRTLYVPIGAPYPERAAPLDANQQVAAVDGPPVVSDSSGVGTVFNYLYDPAVSYELQIQPIMPGNGYLTFTADADLGSGVVTITTTYTVIVYEPGVGFG